VLARKREREPNRSKMVRKMTENKVESTYQGGRTRKRVSLREGNRKGRENLKAGIGKEDKRGKEEEEWRA